MTSGDIAGEIFDYGSHMKQELLLLQRTLYYGLIASSRTVIFSVKEIFLLTPLFSNACLIVGSMY